MPSFDQKWFWDCTCASCRQTQVGILTLRIGPGSLAECRSARMGCPSWRTPLQQWRQWPGLWEVQDERSVIEINHLPVNNLSAISICVPAMRDSGHTEVNCSGTQSTHD